jgi:uncharacterized membrane protein YfcA
MDIYLPIAGQSVNALFIVVLGFLVGVLSGMFGVGGGFLTTPFLIFYGIPPTVAVASATTQITGASVSGVMAHTEDDDEAPAVRHVRWVASLPFRWRFYSSGLYISPVAPLTLGFIAGVLTVFLGIGGGFILVPAMIYLLAMPARVVIGTSLVMVLVVSAVTTMVHSLTTRAVDIVLAGLLLVGGVIGAQYGALLTLRIKPDLMRLALAVIILLVAARVALGLAWRPDEIFSIEYL